MDDDEHDDRDLFVYVYLFVYVLKSVSDGLHPSKQRRLDRWGEFHAYKHGISLLHYY